MAIYQDIFTSEPELVDGLWVFPDASGNGSIVNVRNIPALKFNSANTNYIDTTYNGTIDTIRFRLDLGNVDSQILSNGGFDSAGLAVRRAEGFLELRYTDDDVTKTVNIIEQDQVTIDDLFEILILSTQIEFYKNGELLFAEPTVDFDPNGVYSFKVGSNPTGGGGYFNGSLAFLELEGVLVYNFQELTSEHIFNELSENYTGEIEGSNIEDCRIFIETGEPMVYTRGAKVVENGGDRFFMPPHYDETGFGTLVGEYIAGSGILEDAPFLHVFEENQATSMFYPQNFFELPGVSFFDIDDLNASTNHIIDKSTVDNLNLINRIRIEVVVLSINPKSYPDEQSLENALNLWESEMSEPPIVVAKKGTYTIVNLPALSEELLTNNDFSNGSTGWILADGWSVLNNQLTCDGSNVSVSSATQPNATESTKKYLCEIKTKKVENGIHRLGVSGEGDWSADLDAFGLFQFILTAINPNGIFYIQAYPEFIGVIEHVSLKEIL